MRLDNYHKLADELRTAADLTENHKWAHIMYKAADIIDQLADEVEDHGG